MDPQSQVFTPYNNPPSTNHEAWRLQADVVRIQQLQAEHAERIARLERRQDDDARMKSVWGNSSPFPSVLSGGTPQQAALQHPPSEHFREFDDDAVNLISSLHLDAEDEPRRGMGATSRANSVRFDESANQNHFSHSSRPSMDIISRTSSGIGGLRMDERSSSHKSEGRASSAHSMRSAASGRASSLNLDTGYGHSDSARSPLDTPGFSPGLMLLGAVPAIIRCWMNTNFKHDALLYAAMCTGSYKSFLGLRLIQQLGFEEDIAINEDGTRSVELPVYFPEAVHHPSSSRSSSPAPQLPSLRVNFQVIDNNGVTESESKAIQIFIGSDVLRAHNADILFSSNSMTLFDDERSKLSIPLVRPEDQATFNSLHISSSVAQESNQSNNALGEEAGQPHHLNGLGNNSSRASVSSLGTSPHSGQHFLRNTNDPQGPGMTKGGASNPDPDARPTSRSSNPSRSFLSLITPRSSEPLDTPTDQQQPSSFRAPTNPALWTSWRRTEPTTSTNAPTSPPPNPSTTAPSSAVLDWASTTRPRPTESAPQRREAGIKVLKPKSNANRAVSASVAPATSVAPWSGMGSAAPSTTQTAQAPQAGWIDVRKRGSLDEAKKEGTETRGKANPVGGASAFSWLNSSGAGPGGSKTGP